MTPDVHTFYSALGVDLPRWANLNASDPLLRRTRQRTTERTEPHPARFT